MVLKVNNLTPGSNPNFVVRTRSGRFSDTLSVVESDIGLSGVTDHGNGNYEFLFMNAAPNTQYAVGGTAWRHPTDRVETSATIGIMAKATTSVRLAYADNNTTSTSVACRAACFATVGG